MNFLKLEFAVSYQRHWHGLQTPLGSMDMTSKQSGQLFLPHDESPTSAASAHWRQLKISLPSTVSGYQDSWVIMILHRWNCWIQHGRMYPFEKKNNHGQIQKTIVLGKMVCRPLNSPFVVVAFISDLHMGLPVYSKGTSSKFTPSCIRGNHLWFVWMEAFTYPCLYVCVWMHWLCH